LYSIKEISKNLTEKLIQYLEADYHIWDESLIKARRALLNRSGVISNTPHIEASPTYESSFEYKKMDIPKEAIELLTDLSSIEGSGVFPIPRSHQKEALELFLGKGDEIVVSTGTGSGKTESFLYPIIGSLALEKSRGKEVYEKDGCRVILLYPMNALVNDQLTRLRKMLGNEESSKKIHEYRGRRTTFGVYTSKTDYPGKRDESRDKKIKIKLDKLYLNQNAENNKKILWDEGLWPAKNLKNYIDSGFITSSEDSELFSRQEIQEHAPDILITNYSMLEYMLMRPIERSIFEQTSEWLKAHQDNFLTIVIDEAHMYRGVGGAEVGLLLRRLQSRLGVGREKLRYILTSASFEDEESAVSFANELTGKKDDGKKFKLITGKKVKKENAKLPTKEQLKALDEFNLEKLYQVNNSFQECVDEIDLLIKKLGLGSNKIRSESIEILKDQLNEKLENFPPAGFVYNKLTTEAYQYDQISDEFLTDKTFSTKSFDSLVALCAFAQSKKTKQVFMPLRLHLMFRGIPSLNACINPECSEQDIPENILGALYTHADLACKCGGRIYELLTHRDCGATFIRGYVNKIDPDFLIHEQTSPGDNAKLDEVHYFIEPKRSTSPEYPRRYLHVKSGKLQNKSGPDCIEVCAPSEGFANGLNTFNKCPVCNAGLKTKDGDLKIQDLRTKGEAPFSYLVQEQVFRQPASKTVTKDFPLGGRKTLIFSDGRQKAARLARDIPRNLDKDLFRICLLLSVNYLHERGQKTIILKKLYAAFLFVISKQNLVFFDGNDRDLLLRDLSLVKKVDEDELFDEEDWTPPPKFKELLLTNLCGKYYSLSALTLAYVAPREKALRNFSEIANQKFGLNQEDCTSISINWIASLLSKLAFDDTIGAQIRKNANFGYTKDWGVKKNEKKNIKIDFLDKVDLKALEEEFLECFCKHEPRSDSYFLDPAKLSIKIHVDDNWFQCSDCTKLSTHPIRNKCPSCGSEKLKSLDPNSSEYLRARKGFFRDPCREALNEPKLSNLSVEEHTAQLSYRDEETYSATNELFERRFKDILINPEDTAIDILSCTTTMEVGVDIGSLIAVSMRNVPPERQNYQQRSGRAGRRGAAISTVLTFAQTGSHDSYYFDNAEKIMKDLPPSPKIDVQNVKIIQRHITAAIIQSYFHRFKIDIQNENNNLLSVLGTTKEFYSSNSKFSFASLKNWLLKDFFDEGHAGAIEGWVPNPKIKIRSVVDHLIKELDSGFENAKTQDIKLLDHFFELDLLPTYAFPRHICSFKIEKRNGHRIELEENPQQGLATALTEYAPDRLVVVNKKTYKIGTLAANTSSSEEDRAVSLFKNKKQYLQCSNCMFTELYSKNSINNETCSHCGSDKVNRLDIIQPEVVYPSNKYEVDEHEDDSYSSVAPAQLPYVGPTTELEGKIFRGDVIIGKKSNELLVSINRGSEETNLNGFLVCNKCGKATSSDTPPPTPHSRDYFIYNQKTNSCNGEFEKVFLGYSFNSDVLLIRIPLKSPLNQEWVGIRNSAIMSAARTLAESILQSLSRKLDVNPNEMNCGVRFLPTTDSYNLDIYIYDTASGGAGYSILGYDYSETIFRGARALLAENKCCDSSCYKCLQNYGNRFNHSQLDKRFGLMLLDWIDTQEVPNHFDPNEQERKAGTLIQLMSLEGYEFLGPKEDGLIFNINNKKVKTIIYPFMVDVTNKPKDSVYISDFEVLKSIPTAFSKIIEYAAS
jgi:ATP-dependent helicase YprA (DUF1998 family)